MKRLPDGHQHQSGKGGKSKTYKCNRNKLAKLGDAIAISNLKLSITEPLTDRGRC